jgi:hypothetical protein
MNVSDYVVRAVDAVDDGMNTVSGTMEDAVFSLAEASERQIGDAYTPGAIGAIGGALAAMSGNGIIGGYDFFAYWKMQLTNELMALVDDGQTTNSNVLWFANIVLQLLGQGDYLTFVNILGGLATMRVVGKFVTLKDLYNLLERHNVDWRGTSAMKYAGNRSIRRRRRKTTTKRRQRRRTAKR